MKWAACWQLENKCGHIKILPNTRHGEDPQHISVPFTFLQKNHQESGSQVYL